MIIKQYCDLCSGTGFEDTDEIDKIECYRCKGKGYKEIEISQINKNKITKEQRIIAHKTTLLDIHDLYLRKNENYGDSFLNTRDEVDRAIVVRLMDKLERIKQLTKGNRDKVGESLEDSLIDLAGYAVMEVTEMRLERAEKETEEDEIIS